VSITSICPSKPGPMTSVTAVKDHPD
jgi:hypothetical protein